MNETEVFDLCRFVNNKFDQIIPAGQQIGLMIFSSDKDFTLHPKPGTKLTVDLDGTTIEIPVVGGVDAFEEAIEGK